MKTRIPVILFAITSMLAVAAAAADAPAPTYPAYTIPNSQVRVLPRNAAGRQYQLSIGLPDSYATHPERRYPVVFVTDGYWDFAKMSVAEGSLSYDKVVPEFITVGIGYAGENLDYNKLRVWELTPMPHGDNGENSGHAADFLRTIETEIIPLVERDYRVDSSCRVLAGGSLGGLFTLYTMYSKPELFQGYIAATPGVIVGNDWLLGYEEAFFKSGRPLHARLFVSCGGNESPNWIAGVLRFNARVSSRKNPDLAYKFLVIEGERHGSTFIETYVRGLRFIFEPRAPESGPATAP